MPKRTDLNRRIDARFERELREGASFQVESAALNLESGLRLGHRFIDSANGAVVTWFEPTVEGEITAGLDHESTLEALDAMARSESSFAVRLDGHFASVRARSVPRQSPPYRPLAEVVADQHVFELTDVEGTMVGFRFPAYVEGIEVAGYHLHFVDSERRRGGHVLDSRSSGPLRARIDLSDDLHIELPPAIDLADPDLAAATHAAIDAAERG